MLKVYLDLNCPFCFALHERILQSDNYDDVYWCYIEHAPSLSRESAGSAQHQQLDAEFNLIQQRAPEIEVKRPDFCVNTRLAILSLIMIEQSYPQYATQYRIALYRAYWQQNRDISSFDVLMDILESIGITWLDYSEQAEQLQLNYQKEWENGDFELRLPAIVSDDDRIALGLQNAYNLQSFISGLQEPQLSLDETCNFSGEYKLAFIGLPSLSSAIEQQTSGFNLFNFSSIEVFAADKDVDSFDAILLNFSGSTDLHCQALNQVKELKKAALDFPICCVIEPENAATETLAFSLGANEIFTAQQDILALAARIKKRINTYRAIALLSRYAHVDGMTGLLNRRSFERNMEREWRIGCRAQTVLSVILLDFDCFKAYNDHYGHCEGDECLKKLAQVIRERIYRPSDIAARFGGEEFVLLLPNTDIESARLVAERIRLAVVNAQIPHQQNPVSEYVTISLGLATCIPHSDQTPVQLLELADQSLYQSKENGRNQVTVSMLEQPKYDG